MSHAGPDRRILRAFYTQYVAVLLIILTFTIGAYQRTQGALIQEKPSDSTLPAPHHFLSVPLDNLFFSDGSVHDSDGRLQAIAQVVKNHDIDLQATIQVRRFDIANGSSSMRRAMVRADALERYLRSNEVPAEAISIVLTDAPALDEKVEVDLLSPEVRND